jgi:hypothetical protein
MSAVCFVDRTGVNQLVDIFPIGVNSTNDALRIVYGPILIFDKALTTNHTFLQKSSVLWADAHGLVNTAETYGLMFKKKFELHLRPFWDQSQEITTNHF